MLVSTLTFIIVGFMFIVLFSMIPVIWRIRTDYFGIGDIDENSYTRYVREFHDLAEATREDSRRPDVMKTSSLDASERPDANDVAADRVGERIRYAGSETSDTAEDLADSEPSGGRTLNAAQSKAVDRQDQKTPETRRREDYSNMAAQTGQNKAEAVQTFVEEAAGTASADAARAIRDETKIEKKYDRTVNAAASSMGERPLPEERAYVTEDGREHGKVARAEEWVSDKAEEVKEWGTEKIEKVKKWLDK
ncbi:hypothetical protein C4J81_03345 [Deltaproteobacteria bacterium Smac51]|nr:hypothetical protein C4J81_03345 [Deltaproteobacteria bacterium Smac51]